MGRRRRGYNILSTITLILLLLLGIFISFMLIFKIMDDKRKIEALQDEIEELYDEVDELRTSLEEHEALIKNAEIAENEESVIEVAEPEVERLDMLSIVPGTVVEGGQIDVGNIQSYFCSYPIPEDVFERINGQSYVENSHIDLSQLRYLKLLHYNFDHEIQIGELIVNADLESDFLNIFRELFEEEYEIQSMYLIDNYWKGDGESSDTASIEENNTSAFCYRAVTGGTTISNHGLGRAIDINPQQNPYVNYRTGSPVWSHDNANDYIDRDTGYEHVITHDDICYKIFTKYGFDWGGDWSTIKDYQHFEKP